MTDEDRKLLTGYLSEKWTPIEPCPNCGVFCTGKTVFCLPPLDINRTFTTPQDFHDLVARMDGLGEYEDFISFAMKQDCVIRPAYKPQTTREACEAVERAIHSFYVWLILNPNSCQLVADWLREKEGK